MVRRADKSRQGGVPPVPGEGDATKTSDATPKKRVTKKEGTPKKKRTRKKARTDGADAPADVQGATKTGDKKKPKVVVGKDEYQGGGDSSLPEPVDPALEAEAVSLFETMLAEKGGKKGAKTAPQPDGAPEKPKTPAELYVEADLASIEGPNKELFALRKRLQAENEALRGALAQTGDARDAALSTGGKSRTTHNKASREFEEFIFNNRMTDEMLADQSVEEEMAAKKAEARKTKEFENERLLMDMRGVGRRK